MLSPEELGVIRADLPVCLSVLHTWTCGWKQTNVNGRVLAYVHTRTWICLFVHLCVLDVVAGSNRQASSETLTMTLNFYNMRSKAEPTALLETINHLVDHNYWKQTYDFRGNWHSGEENWVKRSPIQLEDPSYWQVFTPLERLLRKFPPSDMLHKAPLMFSAF